MSVSLADSGSSVRLGSQPVALPEGAVGGRFVDREGERYSVIEHAELMPPFFTCIVSESNHWLFASSNGGLTAGRRNSELSLFPYVTEDKVRDNYQTTGPYTALLVHTRDGRALWEPFRPSAQLAYRVTRNLYKNHVGDKLVFEEVNESLGLTFSYQWCTSDRHGFVRRVTLERHEGSGDVDVLDGVLNLMPACVDEQMQLSFSSLLDAYKSSELVGENGLAVYALASRIVDLAEPREALQATVAYGLGLPGAKVLLSGEQVGAFLVGRDMQHEARVRGRRPAYLKVARVRLAEGSPVRWQLVLDVNRDQVSVEKLADDLRDGTAQALSIEADISRGTQALREIVGRTDGLQLTRDEATTAHHFANTLFNDMRGGVYADGYQVSRQRFMTFVQGANRLAFERNAGFLRELPEVIDHGALVEMIRARGDDTLERLGFEYLPLTFSRRHGDPSRPWNKFDIKVRDERGQRLLAFQGNWRDIFQNWEALSLSHPEYVESIVAKFVNASTLDGYNPYRITESGLDWEVPEPGNPWAGIGYWGDHQIIYLLKLLEMSRAHHPARLDAILERPIFTYANVPYRIRPFDEVKKNPRDTIVFDEEKHQKTLALFRVLGADGKLVVREGDEPTAIPQPITVTLVEKLLVASLAKMGNFIPGGGIWMNTQRPEWNDANNALVGSGVSMVTLYYLTRYFHYLSDLLDPMEEGELSLSSEVAKWLRTTRDALASSSIPEDEKIDDHARFRLVEALGRASSDYREKVYASGPGDAVRVPSELVRSYVAECLRHLVHSVSLGRREDGLYHAYNLLRFDGQGVVVEHLHEMLEGQVAALSAGVLDAEQALDLLRALRQSAMYRPDQDSYMLYPNKQLPGFLEKNRISDETLGRSALLSTAARTDSRLVVRDVHGTARFSPELFNAERLERALREEFGEAATDDEVTRALEVYESVFHHHAFTGRSGTMFGYEGLGSIYWHMVAKLQLAVQENYFFARERGASPAQVEELGRRYYEIRAGVGGFNKSPGVYGAFVVDPYSHTPENSGARQPGMTGQVKEEVLTRFGELGVRVKNGAISFEPSLLRESELLEEGATFEYVGARGEPLEMFVEPGCLALTYCGVPIVMRRGSEERMLVTEAGGAAKEIAGHHLSREISTEVFERTGRLARIDVWVGFDSRKNILPQQ